ncbi:MAG: hypothetical protein ACQER9_00230 [Nanobdellota archaeon]
MFFRKKTQTTVEFIIIISVVIAFLLILTGTIVNLTSLADDKKISQSRSIWASSDIALKEIKWDGEKLEAIIQNNLPYNINITSIEIDENTFSLNKYLTPGETYKLDISVDSPSAVVKFNYKNLKNDKNYTMDGPKIMLKKE